MGEFQDGQFVTGAALADTGREGKPADASAREREPLSRRDLAVAAKSLMPSNGPRDGEPPLSPFDAWGSKSARRQLTSAAEFYSSLDGDMAQRVHHALGAEMAELDEVEPAEDGAQEARERVDLINDFDERTAAMAEEMATATQEAAAEAATAIIEAFGSAEELQHWLDRQPDRDEAWEALAEAYEEGTFGAQDDDEPEADAEAEEAFADWIGPDLLGELEQLSDEDYDEALSDLAEAFVAEHPEYDDDSYDEDLED